MTNAQVKVSTEEQHQQHNALVDINQAIKGRFLQNKTIKPLKRPFISQGKFVYIPNKGLLWQTQKPVSSIKLFANDGVYKVNEQGKLNKEAQLDNDFFLALFSGNEQQLSKYFTAISPQSAEHPKSDCLSLLPINLGIQKLFKQVDLCMSVTPSGDKIPSIITLFEPKGNKTVIELSVLPEKVSDKERSYFE